METLKPRRLTLQLVKLGAVDKWGAQRGEISFVLPNSGHGQVGMGAVARSLAAGDVLVLNGDSGLQLAAQNQAGMAFWNFFVSLEDLFPLLTCQEITLLPEIRKSFGPWKHFPAANRLATSCHRLLAEATSPFDLIHRTQLLKVVALILNEEFNLAHRSRLSRSQAKDHAVEVFEKLTSEEVLQLSIGELAGKFGCSRRHLNRVFNHQFGSSVAAFRMEIRLLKAAALLRSPQAKVINVAQDCGFNHLGLFNLCFKRRFACTPGKWRERGDGSRSVRDGEVKFPQLAQAVFKSALKEGSESKLSKSIQTLGNRSSAGTLPGKGSIVNPTASRPGAAGLAKRGNAI